MMVHIYNPLYMCIWDITDRADMGVCVREIQLPMRSVSILGDRKGLEERDKEYGNKTKRANGSNNPYHAYALAFYCRALTSLVPLLSIQSQCFTNTHLFCYLIDRGV